MNLNEVEASETEAVFQQRAQLELSEINQEQGRSEMNEIHGETFNLRQSSIRHRVEVLFEFSIQRPKPTFYRAVRAADDSFRMEKRGLNAKKFRTAKWCGSEDSLLKFKETVEFYIGK